MTMAITLKNEGPEVYETKIDTYDKYTGEDGQNANNLLANTTVLKMGESATIVVHASRYLVVSEQAAQGGPIDEPKAEDTTEGAQA